MCWLVDWYVGRLSGYKKKTQTLRTIELPTLYSMIRYDTIRPDTCITSHGTVPFNYISIGRVLYSPTELQYSTVPNYTEAKRWCCTKTGLDIRHTVVLCIGIILCRKQRHVFSRRAYILSYCSSIMKIQYCMYYSQPQQVIILILLQYYILVSFSFSGPLLLLSL